MIPHSVSVMWPAVAPALGNHLWQSTVFACAAGLLTLTLRQNQARARYWLWMTASVKFLIPFSLLVGMGTHLVWPHAYAASKVRVYVAMEQAGQPFVESTMLPPTPTSPVALAPHAVTLTTLQQFVHLLPLILTAGWLCGFIIVLVRWYTQWREVSLAVRGAQPLREGREVEMLRRLERIEIGGRRRIEIVVSQASMEPGIFGIARPVLMWPTGMSERLDDAHMEAVLVHEIWHVRRRDNLAAAMHMLVEAMFWFHPLVWWLGSRLVDERERACDEEVLKLCNRPQVYAESILKVCEFCVESPLACVSGVTGSDLKKRIVHIMTEHVARKLNLSKKLLLIVAGSMAIVMPVMVGAMSAPARLARAAESVVAIREAVLPSRTAEPMMAAAALMDAVQATAPSQAPAAPPTVAAAQASEVHAHGDLTGDWQGTLVTPNQSLRIIARVAKADKGWSAKMYSIDQKVPPLNTSGVTFDGTTFKFSVDQIGGTYEGKLSADGSSIVGNWTQGPSPLPLTLVRATKETAWEIPAPPAPPKLMAGDANPSFEVATIKPNDSGAAQMQGLNVSGNGHNFTTRNSSLGDLIAFAYNLQPKQIIGGPDWLDKDRFDIAAISDTEGMPNGNQLRSMIQKLLGDRWKLTFHHDKKELSAFVLTVGKNGQKLTPSDSKVPLPGLGAPPVPGGVMLVVNNGTMDDFTGLLQMLVLDRPVVDRTGIAGRYNFSFKFVPDDSMFHGHPPKPGAATDTTDALPGFFEGIQTIGLKLDAEKTPVDVIVIDHAEKYSAN
jgi:uncharacterized protein (TIGR03435 family)